MLLTRYDHDRLFELIRSSGSPAAVGNAVAELARKLEHATIIPSETIPPDVVTMNSVVTLVDLSSGAASTYSLVYPKDADVDGLKISVLARLGVAMLCQSEGAVFSYTVPSGTRQYLVHKVVYQPESRLRQAGTNGAVAV